ncbi:Glucooligosaccharide oxidase [Aulographum hederae CBS 113979]|uniref:Glucooligosaccharide oxidase n=1 Tax=Aulographum hederae CBS 113979 TaxID=1176131 RepID=A0A6G1GMH9_9PEZI|nr:Glucooligosaccharide oxidase [Aulographum hederae CBS 113979]
MQFVAVAAAWAIEKLTPQKILFNVGLASLLTSQLSIHSELGPKLSNNASIYVRGDPQFPVYIKRWTDVGAPNIEAIVDWVRYANMQSRPFIARTGGHGSVQSLAGLKDGIQIDMHRMDKVEVSQDGKTAMVGGGARVKRVIEELRVAGKQTPTGICECVGLAGAGLGGGHGWLQRQYGLIIDQLVEAQIVLSNGSAATVSATSNPEFFWAFKGAGHNFGIVTEMKLKVYDVEPDHTWAYEIFIFTGDKLEEISETTNRMMKVQGPKTALWAYMLKIPEIDPDHLEIATPIRDLGPIDISAGVSSLDALANLTFMGMDGPACAQGGPSWRFPIRLKSYSVPAMREVYDRLDQAIQTHPEFSNSVFIFEGYPTHGVKGVLHDSTAFPHRDDEILLSPFISYAPDPKLNSVAIALGKAMREDLLQGTEDPGKLRAYVNYAHGDKSVEAMYGYEEWRVEKLRALKKQWDPEDRMRWYAPIV